MMLVNSQTNITNLSLTKSKYCSPKTRSKPSNHNQRLLLTIHPLQTVAQGGTSSEADQGSKTRSHIDLGSLAEPTAILRNRNPESNIPMQVAGEIQQLELLSMIIHDSMIIPPTACAINSLGEGHLITLPEMYPDSCKRRKTTSLLKVLFSPTCRVFKIASSL